MTLEVGYIVKYRNGNLREIKSNGTYIDFDNSVWLEVAEKSYANGDIVSVYKQA